MNTINATAATTPAFTFLHDITGSAEIAILGKSLREREVAFYTFFVQGPSMLTVIVFLLCLLFHG